MGRAELSRRIAPWLAPGAPLLLYRVTSARDLGAIDSGELATVCAQMGIAHPTGYPLYTLLGRLAVLLLPAGETIARLNALSGIGAAISCLFVFFLFRALLARVRPQAPELARDTLSLGGAWVWAVHPALWSQATGNEVHALQAALAAGVLWAATSGKGRGPSRRLALACYGLGLGLTNHLTILYLVPGLAAGVWIDGRGAGRRGGRGFAVLGACLLAPLLLYLYLPIRSAADPLLDWGDPTTLERIVRHVGAWQYRVWMFSSAANVERNLGQLAREIFSPLTLPVAAAAIAGLFVLARRDRGSLARLGLGLLVGVVWAAGYDIHDIEPYFLVARLCLAGCAVAGVSLLLPPLPPRRKRFERFLRPAAAIPLLAALALALVRFPAQDRRGDHFVRLYAESLLDALPERTLLITHHWDMVVSPLIYVQQVEGRRGDVTIVDTELLRRSWYYPQLRRADPGLLAPVEDRVAAFLEQLRLFEAGRPYDPRLIEERYRGVIAGIFEAHAGARPIFHTPEVEAGFYRGWAGVPEAQAIRIVRDPAQAPACEPLDAGRWAAQMRYAGEPVRRQALGFLVDLARARARFLQAAGRGEESQGWQRSAEALAALRPEGKRGLD
jgi:hypothetical protein